jgi:HTH-type transcriptional repressor of NAD biosynthesis genes
MFEEQGIAIGKFMPLHKGHEHMIKFAAGMLDTLLVLVSGSEDDEIPLSERYEWVKEFVSREQLFNVCVIHHTDNSPTPINIDEDGTVLDEEFQQYWVDEFIRVSKSATHVVSSDLYGKVLAERMGLEWLPVDPNRKIVPISATAIRKDPVNNFEYISDYAASFKSSARKRITVVGAESTGKSTLTKLLAREFSGSLSTEYGRVISEARGLNLSGRDFDDIFRGQIAQDKVIEKNSVSPFMFIDTEAYTTYLFGQIYLGKNLDYISQYAEQEDKIDLYILMKSNVEFVQDGGRILEEQSRRDKFFDDMKSFLVMNNKNYVIIDEDNHRKRYNQASRAVFKELYYNMKEYEND